MTKSEIKASIEAILFANGAPVEQQRLCESLDLPFVEISALMAELIEEYSSPEKGLEIIALDESYQMITKKQTAEFVRKAMDLRRSTPLSQAALEVLAIVAYNQPVTKSYVEQIRGVDCSGVMGSLVTKNLVEEKGRLDLPGRPLLYGTTDNFLRCFSISTLDDLPPLPKNEELSAADTENSDIEDSENFDINEAAEALATAERLSEEFTDELVTEG